MNETQFKDKLLKDFRANHEYWFKYPAGPRGGSIPDLIGASAERHLDHALWATAIEAKCIDIPIKASTLMLPFKALTPNQRREIDKMQEAGWDCWVAVLIRPINYIAWYKYDPRKEDPQFYKYEIDDVCAVTPKGFPQKYGASPQVNYRKKYK